MYATNPCFSEVWNAFQQPIIINQTPFLYYMIYEGCLYKLNQLCVPENEYHLILIREEHAYSCGGNFGIAKTILNLQFHFYWPTLSKQVEKFIHTCSLYSQSKPSNHLHGLYQPLPVPSLPWNPFPWTFWGVSLPHFTRMRLIGSYFFDSQRWLCSFPVRKLQLFCKLPTSFSNMCGRILDYLVVSFYIVTLASSVPCGVLYGLRLDSMSITPSHFTFKLTTK